VIRLSSIGDIILTTPVLKALRSRYPEAQIDFLVMDRFKDAIQGVPWVDNLILFPKDSCKGLQGLIRFGKQLSQAHYDVVIDLHAKIRSIVIVRQLKTKVLRYRKRAWWKSILVPLGLTTYHVDDTIIRNYFRPLSKLDVYYTREELYFHFDPSDLEAVQMSGEFVVLAPGAANQTKKWLPEYFGRLGHLIQKPIVIVGGKASLKVLRRSAGSSVAHAKTWPEN